MKYTFKKIGCHSLDLRYASTANWFRDRLSSNMSNDSYYSHMAGAMTTDNLASATWPGCKEFFIFACVI